MKYNPQIHHRKSIRLKGYDYSQAGLYFITICAQNRAFLFGDIQNDKPMCPPEMILNDPGKMVEHWYYELENKFNDVHCHTMVIMPNHFHCIVEIVAPVTVPVGADLRVCPNANTNTTQSNGSGSGEPNGSVSGEPNVSGERDVSGEHNGSGERDGLVSGEHVGSPLRNVVQWFKTMTTNHYIRGVKQNGWQPFDGKLWQRNYWEHIIRNDDEYQRITQYIINNPQKWEKDKLNQNDTV